MNKLSQYITYSLVALSIGAGMFSLCLVSFCEIDAKTTDYSAKSGIYDLKHNDLAITATQQTYNTHSSVGKNNTHFSFVGSPLAELSQRSATLQYLVHSKSIIIGLSVQDIIFPSHFFF